MANPNSNMTVATPKDYWLSPNALHIERNALGNPDYIQASCVSGAQILVYIKGIISYDAGHNYRRWPLQASPTVFNTHTEKYVYVAVPRDSTLSTAIVVYPSELLDIYGKNEQQQQVGSEKYYYIFLQGILSSSGDNGTCSATGLRAIPSLRAIFPPTKPSTPDRTKPNGSSTARWTR